MSTFDFNTKTTSTINTEFKGQSTITTPVDGTPAHIPVMVKSHSTVPTAYGDTARDAWLKFQLDNETGYYLGIENFAEQDVLTLYSKTNKPLSSVNLAHELPSILGVSDKYLYVDCYGTISWKEGPGGGSESSVRILYNTVDGWNSQKQLVSQLGSVYVYTDKDKYITDTGEIIWIPGIKIGDGNAYLIDKPFITTAVEQKLIKHMEDVLTHIQPGEREKWNNKLNYIEPGNSGLLEFTRN